jgi:hypothetical protein
MIGKGDYPQMPEVGSVGQQSSCNELVSRQTTSLFPNEQRKAPLSCGAAGDWVWRRIGAHRHEDESLASQ